MSETQAFERTASARRRRGRAYGRAELHHRLVERPRPLGGDEASGDLADPSLGCGPRHVVRDPEEAGDDASHVPVHGGDGDPEGDARDGAGRVRSHPREGCKLFEGFRELAAVPLYDCSSGGVQVPRATIEAEALQQRKDVVEGRGRDVLDGGESGDEALVVWRSGDDPSALEEVLGDENAVRVGRATPRKVPTVRIVPREHARADLDRGQLSHHRVRCAAGYIRDSGHRGKAAEPFTLTLNKVDSLENLTRLPAPENQVKHRHGDLDIARESLHPRLDL